MCILRCVYDLTADLGACHCSQNVVWALRIKQAAFQAVEMGGNHIDVDTSLLSLSILHCKKVILVGYLRSNRRFWGTMVLTWQHSWFWLDYLSIHTICLLNLLCASHPIQIHRVPERLWHWRTR